MLGEFAGLIAKAARENLSAVTGKITAGTQNGGEDRTHDLSDGLSTNADCLDSNEEVMMKGLHWPSELTISVNFAG